MSSSTCARRSELCHQTGTGRTNALAYTGWGTHGFLDTVYGSHRPLREGLETRSQAYALAVSCQERVEVQGERVDRLADTLGPDQWQRITVGDGSKGPRDFDWAYVELASPSKPGWKKWLLVRRSLVEGAKPAERAYVLVFAPCETTLAEMAEAI